MKKDVSIILSRGRTDGTVAISVFYNGHNFLSIETDHSSFAHAITGRWNVDSVLKFGDALGLYDPDGKQVFPGGELVDTKSFHQSSFSITKDNRGTVRFSVYDEKSSIRVVESEMSVGELAKLIMDRACSATAEFAENLEAVSKRRVIEKRSVKMNGNGMTAKQMESWIMENMAEDGWTINPSLSSMGSIEHDVQGMKKLNYSVYRYESDATNTMKDQDVEALGIDEKPMQGY